MRSARSSKGFLVDLDGTLVSGQAALPGAAALLESLDRRFVIVSNNAEHTPLELSRGLRRLGLNVRQDRIVLAGVTALDGIARQQPGARVLMLAGKSLMSHARDQGLILVQSRADIVFLGRDRHFSYERLALAANAVRDGAALVVANPDLVHPGRDGAVVPETGALLAALLACTGPVPYRIIGKPEPFLFEAGLSLLGLPARDVTMIGDNPATDGEGARRLGMRFLAIRDGLLPSLSPPQAADRDAWSIALPTC